MICLATDPTTASVIQMPYCPTNGPPTILYGPPRCVPERAPAHRITSPVFDTEVRISESPSHPAVNGPLPPSGGPITRLPPI